MLRCADGHEFEWSSAHGYVEQPHPVRSHRLAEKAYRAEWLTAELRGSPNELHASLRAAITGVGLPVGTTYLAELFPDGTGVHWGALVTAERRVLTFILRAEGDFTYEDRTLTWEQLPHKSGVHAVLLGLDEG